MLQAPLGMLVYADDIGALSAAHAGRLAITWEDAKCEMHPVSFETR